MFAVGGVVLRSDTLASALTKNKNRGQRGISQWTYYIFILKSKKKNRSQSDIEGSKVNFWPKIEDVLYGRPLDSEPKFQY